jgi:formylmethanofuran dehydrogenase subunit E
MKHALALPIVALLLTQSVARAETPEEWVTLGTRVHGGFGSFIPLGIRIGEDALHRLGAQRRDVTVTYSTGGCAPCPCVADGIAIATTASVGQGTLHLTAEPSPEGTLGVAIIKDKKTGKGFRYTIPAAVLPKMLAWNKGTVPLERFRLVMDAPPEFEVEPAD